MRALSREWEAPWDYWETRKQTDSNCTVEVHTMHLKRKSYRSPSSTLCPLSNPRSSCSTGAILLHCKKEGPLSLWANSVWTLRIEPKRRESLCFCSRGLGHSPSKVVGFAIFLISQLFLSRTASVLCFLSSPFIHILMSSRPSFYLFLQYLLTPGLCGDGLSFCRVINQNPTCV